MLLVDDLRAWVSRDLVGNFSLSRDGQSWLLLFFSRMERRNLYGDSNGAEGPSVRWSIDGTKDDWEMSRYGDKAMGNYNLGFSQERILDRKSEILLVDIEAGPSGVSNVNTSAPSVNPTLETRVQCPSAPGGILLNIQNSRGCCTFPPSACACGWCAKKPEECHGTRCFNQTINPGRNFIAYGIIFLITIIAITTTLLHFTLHIPEHEIQSVTTYCTGSTAENLDWYVSRESWKASNPTSNLEMSAHKRSYVMVGHTVTSYCKNLERCSRQMRNLQRNAMNEGFADIPYHFVIGGDGRVYEGRTWQAAPENEYHCDNDCLLVSFTGDYRNCCSAPNHVPSEEQMQAFDYLLDTSRRLNRLKENFAILPQCKVASSQSPGSNLYNAIKDCNQFDLTAGTFTGSCNLNCAGEC